jgi:DNA-binding NarL/FixJ family response regulator
MVTKVRSRVRGRPAYKDVLTPAEWRVVHSAQHGLTNKEIAGMLQISIDGVKYHVANALSKLGLENKKALPQWFQVPLGSALEDRMNQKESSHQGAVALTHLGQVSRTVSNLKKSVEFFRDILNVPHLFVF